MSKLTYSIANLFVYYAVLLLKPAFTPNQVIFLVRRGFSDMRSLFSY